MQSHLTYAHTPAHRDHWLLCPRVKGPLHQGCLAEEGRGPLAGSTWEAGPGAGRAWCPVHPHGGHRDADAPRGAPRGLPSCVTCPRLSQDPRLLWLWGPGQRGRSAEAHEPPGACMRAGPPWLTQAAALHRGPGVALSPSPPLCQACGEWGSRPGSGVSPGGTHIRCSHSPGPPGWFSEDPRAGGPSLEPSDPLESSGPRARGLSTQASASTADLHGPTAHGPAVGAKWPPCGWPVRSACCGPALAAGWVPAG